jgi:hypothetical protein
MFPKRVGSSKLPSDFTSELYKFVKIDLSKNFLENPPVSYREPGKTNLFPKKVP